MILSAKEKLGWRGMFRVLRCTRWKSDVVWSLLITVSIFLILSLSWGCDWIGLLDKITQSLLSIYGGLLGVSIAAYALLLGMPHLRRIMGIILPGKSSSLYAQTYAQFTLYLLFQLLSLLGVFITSILLDPKTIARSTTGCVCIDKVMNALVLFTILFSFIYQAMLMKDSFILIYNGAIYIEATSEREE